MLLEHTQSFELVLRAFSSRSELLARKPLAVELLALA